jgi:hypothetical protein
MRAFCDNCGREAVRDECNVLSARRIQEGDDVEFLIACKVDCSDKVDPDRLMANQELGQCVLNLAVNCKIDIQKEVEFAEDMYKKFGLIY